MADQPAIARSPIEVLISPSQLNTVLKSHRELHEAVIELTKIIQDPSRSASYQSFPRDGKQDIDLENENPQPDDSHSYTKPFRSGLSKGYQEVNESKSGQSVLRSSSTCPVPDHKHASFQEREGTFYRCKTWPKSSSFQFTWIDPQCQTSIGLLLLQHIEEFYMICNGRMLSLVSLVAPGRNFDLGNARARKEYNRKKEQSRSLYARAVSSSLAAEYDFQCKRQV